MRHRAQHGVVASVPEQKATTSSSGTRSSAADSGVATLSEPGMYLARYAQSPSAIISLKSSPRSSLLLQILASDKVDLQSDFSLWQLRARVDERAAAPIPISRAESSDDDPYGGDGGHHGLRRHMPSLARRATAHATGRIGPASPCWPKMDEAFRTSVCVPRLYRHYGGVDDRVEGRARGTPVA